MTQKGIPERGHSFPPPPSPKSEERRKKKTFNGMWIILVIAIIGIGAVSIMALSENSGDDLNSSTTTPAPTTTMPPTTTPSPATTSPPTTTPAPTTTMPPTTTPSPATTSPPTTIPPEPEVLINVYHFHGTHSCSSCVLAYQYAHETLVTYYQKELDNNTITLDSINYEDPDYRSLVYHLNVYGSSVFVVVTTDGEEEIYNPTTKLWMLVNDEESFVEYFKNYIGELL